MDMTKDIPGEELARSARDLAEMLGNGVTTVRDLKGVSDGEMDAVYALAHDFYQTGRYDDAETLFRFLVLFDHLNPKYHLALGAVLQVKKDFDSAIKCYSLVCGLLDIKNVKASFYSAECYLAKGDRESALSALMHVDTYADVKTEEGREFKAKAAKLRKLVEGAAAVE